MSAWCQTVLVAEDSVDTAEMLKRMFVGRGYHVLMAENGVEALRIASQKQPHLMIIDLNMPKLDGLETIKQLRSIEGCLNTPIIVITAFDVYGMEEAARANGGNEYLSKPIDLDLLDRVLKGLGFVV